MSERGAKFMREWILNNIPLEPYAEDGKANPAVEPLVEQCLSDAKQAGISRKELEEDAGYLEDAIEQALEERTDAEVERLAAKND